MSEELNLLLSKIESQLEQKGILNKKMSRSYNFTMKDNLKKEMEQKILNILDPVTTTVARVEPEHE